MKRIEELRKESLEPLPLKPITGRPCEGQQYKTLPLLHLELPAIRLRGSSDGKSALLCSRYTPLKPAPATHVSVFIYKKNKINLISNAILYFLELLKTYNIILEDMCSGVFA
jgi:hypothetical protein